MLPDGSSPADKRPCFKRLDEGRLIIPVESVPDWAKGQHPVGLRMVPLVWKRSLPELPPTNRLDCWYLWNPAIACAEWELDPQRIIDQQISNAALQARLEFLIFEAAISTLTRTHRLQCANLLPSLGARSQEGAWIVPERDGSISVWADGAFQLYHSRLE